MFGGTKVVAYAKYRFSNKYDCIIASRLTSKEKERVERTFVNLNMENVL